jgi:hypothetical protein
VKKKKLNMLLFFVLYAMGALAQSEPGKLRIIGSMVDSIRRVKNASYHMKALERVDGKFLIAESNILLQMKPRWLYFRNDEKKLSVLYKEGENKNEAFVKAKQLLNATLSLDPYGSLMRKNQHYTIFDIGFEFLGSVMARALLSDKEQIDKNIEYLGKKNWSEYTCYVLKYEDPNFHFYDYFVKKGESVSALAIRFNVSDYVIRKKNNLSSYYGKIKVGSKIVIPSNYVKKVIMYIDEKTMLPVNVITFDEEGIYESYELTRLKINRKLSTEDFNQFYRD